MKRQHAQCIRKMGLRPERASLFTTDEVQWNNSRLIKGNVAEEVSWLRQQPGKDILIAGSGELVHMLMQNDLIDEYRLLVYSVVLGSGKSLFEGLHDRLNLKLVSSKTFSSGVVLLCYQPEKKTA